jgi:hypothetical protein
MLQNASDCIRLRMLQNATEGSRMHQNASEIFRMVQIASECFRLHQKASVAVFKLVIKERLDK